MKNLQLFESKGQGTLVFLVQVNENYQNVLTYQARNQEILRAGEVP